MGFSVKYSELPFLATKTKIQYKMCWKEKLKKYNHLEINGSTDQFVYFLWSNQFQYKFRDPQNTDFHI